MVMLNQLWMNYFPDIKPNAVINGYESLIRATLIGNGFIIPKCKTINIYNL